MHPIDDYRRAQGRVRRLFEPFTRTHCATCLTPCCRKPSWVRPTDIVLVEELGFRLPKPTSRAAQEAAPPLFQMATGVEPEDAGEPCEYLGPSGCTFPADLRPFGCTAFICGPMRAELSVAELAAVERAVRELEAAHARLIEELFQPVPGPVSAEDERTER